ncbi:MAG: DUF2273 domain-containing protein [Chloroflexota bacterium]|nr:DUF2273 domain-containing protein [Chloroflexota bacterium]
MLHPKTIGAIAGLVVGLVIVTLGLLKAIIVALFVLAGWYVGKVYTGEIDLIDIYERFKSNREKKREG